MQKLLATQNESYIQVCVLGDGILYVSKYIYSFVLATLTFGELSNILGMLPGNPQICRQYTL